MDLNFQSKKSINNNCFISYLSKFPKIEANLILKSYFNINPLYGDYKQYYDHYIAVKKLLVEEKNVDIVNEIILFTKDEINSIVNKNGLIHKIVIRGDIALLEIFIKCNINVTSKNKQGFTPLHLATINKQFAIIELFLKYNIDISILDNNGFSFLDYYDFSKNIKIKNLLSENYNINVDLHKSLYQNNITTSTIYDMIVENKLEDIKKLSIRELTNYNIENENHLLKMAMIRNNEDIVKYFISKNMCVDIMFDNPLIYKVIYNENNIILDSFIENDVYIMDELDYYSMTFLEKASTTNPSIIKRLMDYGIDFYAKDKKDKSGINYAMIHFQFDNVAFLINACKDIQRYSYTDVDILSNIYDRFNEPNICKFMIENNVYIPKRNKILHLASEQGDLDFVKYLLNKGFDINLFSSEFHSPLIYAIFRDHIEVVKYLISNGANTNYIKKYMSPLYMAIIRDNVNMVKCYNLINI